VLQLDLETGAAVLLQEPLGKEQGDQFTLGELEERQAEVGLTKVVTVAVRIELDGGLKPVAEKNDVALDRSCTYLQLPGQRVGVGPTARTNRSIDKRNPRQRAPRGASHDHLLEKAYPRLSTK
jgi:hypothetical protein